MLDLVDKLTRTSDYIQKMATPDLDLMRAGIVGSLQGMLGAIEADARGTGEQDLAAALKRLYDTIESKFPSYADEDQDAHVEDDIAGERNWEAEAQEATYVGDQSQRWYQCDEDEPVDPDEIAVPDLTRDDLESEALHEWLVASGSAVPTAEELRLADLYDC